MINAKLTDFVGVCTGRESVCIRGGLRGFVGGLEGSSERPQFRKPLLIPFPNGRHESLGKLSQAEVPGRGGAKPLRSGRYSLEELLNR